MVSRRIASIASLVLGAACADGSVGAPLLPLPLSKPVREVIVYTWPSAVQVGDTMTVLADAFDSTGHGTAGQSLRTWTLSDSSLATATSIGATRSAAVFRGLRPGWLGIRVAIGGVSGRDSLRVIPTLAPLQISPTSLTLGLRDSAAVKVRIVDLDGVPVKDLVVVWTSTDYLVTVGRYRDSTMVLAGGRVGTSLLRATVANSVVTLPVTVS